jgi:Beta protein
MTEFTKRYYPTVCIRRAEMKAMEKLPESEKTKMLPIVLLAPWLNSIEFENTFRIVEKSIGNGPIIVDIDRHFFSESTLPSRQFFRDLLDPDDGPARWMELIKNHDNYIPCIQLLGIPRALITEQIEIAKALNRGFVFRIELERHNDIDGLISIISENLDQNCLIILDYGYSDRSEIVEMKISNLMDRFLSLSGDLRFVVSGASFPNAFSEFDDFANSKSISARLIYSNLARQFGNYNFFYGDWASTKPRKYDGGGSKPLPRIDFPTPNSWIIARSKENEWDFQQAAEMVTRLPEWQKRPMVWGTGMIEKAAKGLPGGISTGPQAIASRVNIHLYLQNNFGNTTPLAGPQGKWIDPI